jgi:hypothetical protein
MTKRLPTISLTTEASFQSKSSNLRDNKKRSSFAAVFGDLSREIPILEV